MSIEAIHENFNSDFLLIDHASYEKVFISGEILSIHAFPLTETDPVTSSIVQYNIFNVSYGQFNPNVTTDLLPPNSRS